MGIRITLPILLLAALAPTAAAWGQTQNNKAGAAPSKWSGTKNSSAQGETLCIGICDNKKFTIPVHKVVQADLWQTTSRGPVCTDALNEGLYAQDLGEFYKAEAHFDNCAFSESLDYLQQFRKSGDSILVSARRAFEANRDRSQLQASVVRAIKEYGRALHIIQDFYAHTNYVDTVASKNLIDTTPAILDLRKRSVQFSENLAIPLWQEAGARTILKLQKNARLVSGTVFYETARLNKCTAGSPTHSQLAKDAPDKGKGAEKTRWSGLTHHEAAVSLAKNSTRQFVLEIAKEWPEIESVCGDFMRVLQVNDQRSFVAQ